MRRAGSTPLSSQSSRINPGNQWGNSISIRPYLALPGIDPWAWVNSWGILSSEDAKSEIMINYSKKLIVISLYDQFMRSLIRSILLWSLESLLWVSSHLFFNSCDSCETCSFANFLLFATRWTKWKILTFQLCSRKVKNKSTAYRETFKNNFLGDDAMLWVLPVKTEVCYRCCHNDLFHPCGIFLVFLSFLFSHILRCFMIEKKCDH